MRKTIGIKVGRGLVIRINSYAKFLRPILMMGLLCFDSAANVGKLAERIVALRLEVEDLNNLLLSKKESLAMELKSKGTRLSQLEMEVDREEIKKKKADQKLATLKARLKKLGSAGENLKPLILKQLAILDEMVESDLPFQTGERQKEIKDIEDKIKAGTFSSQKALGKLWALVEDEMRLGREIALHRQSIELEGDERLASVAKIGMMLLYFKTLDNKVGYGTRNQIGELVYWEERDPARKKLILKLIDGLKKQIRYGRYNLPLPVKEGA